MITGDQVEVIGRFYNGKKGTIVGPNPLETEPGYWLVEINEVLINFHEKDLQPQRDWLAQGF